MIKLYIGTSNKYKLKEYYSYLSNLTYKFELLSINLEVDEPYNTVSENAEHKAKIYSNHVDGLVVSDDLGLFVNSLDGLPGVYSARFYNAITEIDSTGSLCISGFDNTLTPKPKDINELNIQKVLSTVRTYPVNNLSYFNIKCHYNTSICIASKGKILKTINGKCEGYVADKPYGKGGFGYDSIFIPSFEITKDTPKTFAELKEKDAKLIAARGNTLPKLKLWLENFIFDK